MFTENTAVPVLSRCGGVEARRDAPAAQIPLSSAGPNTMEVVHSLAHTAGTLKNHEESKRAATVRWTSPLRNTAVMMDEAVAKPQEEKHCMNFPCDTQPPPTTSPSTVVNALVDTTTTAATRDGPLSLENLLRESQQQLSELLWHKRRCRTLQAALDASVERQKALENDLLESSAESQNASEQHRAYVAATAEELRLTKAGLQAGEHALHMMEDEVGGLRRENERLRKLQQQVEAERTLWRRQHDGMEKERTRLRGEKERVEGELITFRARCAELEKLHAAMEGTRDASAVGHHKKKDGNIADDCEEEEEAEEDGAEKDEVRAVTLLQQQELDRQCVEMIAVKKSTESFRKDVQHMVAMTWKRLTALAERGAQLTSALTAGGNQLQPLTEVQREDVPDTDAAPVALASLLQRLEQQWSGVEETAMSVHRESQERLKDLQNRLDAMTDAHVVELQTMKNATQEANDQIHRMELQYTQLLGAMERQSRMVLAATNTDVRKCKGVKTSPKEEGEDDKWNSTNNSNISREDNSEGQSEEHMQRMVCEVDTLQPNEWHLESKECLTCETILDPSYERAVYALVRRTRQAARNAARQLREARSMRDTLAKLQEEKQRQSVVINEERVRHQVTVRRLQTSLKSANETLSSLQTQLTAATRTHEVERHALVRRAEAAERDVQAKLRQERQLQKQLRELHEKYEAAEQEAAARGETIAELNTKLVAHQNATREEQFDLNTLRSRCGDLVRMTDVLETQMQREVRNQDFLYELARKLCAALALLTLRLGIIAAERFALWRAYEAQEADCRAAVQVIHKFIREEENREETMLDLHEMDRVLHSHHGHSLYAVVAVVIACGRMRHLVPSRSNKRCVAFAVSNENGEHDKKQHSGQDFTDRAQPPSWRMLSSNNILRLVESVPIVSAALRWQPGGKKMPFVQLPPLKTLLGVIASHARSGTAEYEETYALEQTLALAELDAGVEVNRVYFGANLSPGLTAAGAGGAMRRRILPRVTSHDTHCRGKLAQMLHVVLGSMRDTFAELRKRMRQQDVSIQLAEEEGHQLRRIAQEREGVATGFAQKLREYERHVARSYIGRDVYQQLQERLRAAYDALQKERESRRTVEEANAALHQRELELTRIVQHLRDEVRSLSMELAERPSHDSSQHRSSAASRLSAPLLSPSRSGPVNNSKAGNSAPLYVPRSVRMTLSPQVLTCVTEMHTDGNDEVCGQWDEAVQEVISGLEMRIERAENPIP
ncbi:hypothetical protein TRSC58_04613 [Trypanosoma rangeli SC58]|uniref:Uncharacterized protein n=1 Tax=Trypanosoma rangeli SC58 TaxID=429131 RepID=A0A061IYD8_TRYRA|nr:hypothetical protein TRSC58_04613 [Trypanosoma rangeli SC58]